MIVFGGVVLGVALLLVGGTLMVRGASAIASGAGISPMVVGLTVVGDRQEILVWAGQRYLRMGARDLEHFRGDRAHRGLGLPRGAARPRRHSAR